MHDKADPSPVRPAEPGEEEYRAASDTLLETLARLHEIETVKRRVEPGTQEFIDVAREAERLARRVFRWAQFQLRIAEASPGLREQARMSGRPIEEVIARPLDRILALWREAEFRLDRAERGSAEAEEATADIERYREEFAETYARITEPGRERPQR
jgi:hypothetical protein